MPHVELIYDADCPNIHASRRVLLLAFAKADLQPSWTEWERKSPDSPPHARRYGSPTILVDGHDIMGAELSDGSDCCRVYDHGSGASMGVPPASSIVAALTEAHGSAPASNVRIGSGWWRPVASLPSMGAALLPVGTCPACWPAYAAILGPLGLGFLLDSTLLLPATIALFGLALFGLGFRARSRNGYGPLVVGMASIVFILAFKFAYEFSPMVYMGLAGLAAASLWNAWPRKSRLDGSCPKCMAQSVGESTNAP